MMRTTNKTSNNLDSSGIHEYPLRAAGRERSPQFAHRAGTRRPHFSPISPIIIKNSINLFYLLSQGGKTRMHSHLYPHLIPIPCARVFRLAARIINTLHRATYKSIKQRISRGILPPNLHIRRPAAQRSNQGSQRHTGSNHKRTMTTTRNKKGHDDSHQAIS